MNSTKYSDDKVAKLSRMLFWMIVGVAALVVGVSGVAFWMSFSVLQDLAIRSSIPAAVAWGLPLVIDGSIVAAILVILAWRLCGKRLVWAWIVLVMFSIVSIVGNGAHTMIAHDAGQGVPMWLAVTLGAIPPIGLMTSCEMLVRLPKARDIEAAVNDQVLAAESAEAPKPVVEALSAPVSVATEVPEPSAAVVEDAPAVVGPALADATAVDPVVPAVEPVAEPVAEPEPVADDVAVEVDAAADSDIEIPSAEVTPIHPAEPVPATKAERIEHIITLAESGEEISTKDLAEQYGATERSVQRYVKEARQKAPEAFADAEEAEDLVKVS